MHIIGNDATVVWAAANGDFGINVMMPVLARNLAESVGLLGMSARSLAGKAIRDFEVDEEWCSCLLE